ncbi:MAG TPA: hypothetical protein VE573_10750 [Nitrososphaeraceae archaeon]|nr:hypothetical protein [Nitrososphaeraceae archaeon]
MNGQKRDINSQYLLRLIFVCIVFIFTYSTPSVLPPATQVQGLSASGEGSFIENNTGKKHHKLQIHRHHLQWIRPCLYNLSLVQEAIILAIIMILTLASLHMKILSTKSTLNTHHLGLIGSQKTNLANTIKKIRSKFD